MSCFLKYPADTRAAINTPRARHLFHVTAHNQSMDVSVLLKMIQSCFLNY